MPRSSIINNQLRSQTDPFSNFRLNFGNVEQVRQSSLRTLGALYFQTSPNIQKRIDDAFIAATRDLSPTVRKGVAMGLTTMAQTAADNATILPMRILIALVVLLRHPDADPCSWACDAAGRLIAQGRTGDFAHDLLDRVIDLAVNSTAPVEVRVGTAIAMHVLKDYDLITDAERDRVSGVLTKLRTT